MIDAKTGKIVKGKSHLVQEMRTTIDKDGNPVTTVKLPGKLEAVKISNSMQGFDAPMRIQGELTLSALLSARDPGATTGEEVWIEG